MRILVTYDVNTEKPEGRKRLRHVCQGCKNFGQRVQKSVFECDVNDVELEKMIQCLCSIINIKEDSLRIYRLTEPLGRNIKVFGLNNRIEFDDAIIV